MRTLLAFMVLCSTAFAQIDVPAETPVYSPIEATVSTTVREGDDFLGGWSSDDGVSLVECGKGKVFIWATPGEHRISYSGVCIHLGPAITVKDVNGKEHTFRPYISPEQIKETAVFRVTGGTPPDPPPSPAPIPVAGLRVLIVRESNLPLPMKQQAMINSTVWRASVGQGNWMVLDPDTQFRKESIWKDAMVSTKDQGVPRLIVSNHPRGGYVGPLPKDLDALMAVVEEWK